MKLTIKQENFCNLYMETGNATEAYRRAYDCGNMKYDTIVKRAGELLNNGVITGRLEKMRTQLNEQSNIRKQQILEELKAMAFSDIGDFVEFDGTTLAIKPFEDLTIPQRRMIEAIKKGKYGIEIRLHGKTFAIDRICKMLGFDAPIIMEQKINTGFEDIQKEELQERLMRMLKNEQQNDARTLSGRIGDA
ncbi:MAG: terminase small subunit [Tannerellaceae bacterium]